MWSIFEKSVFRVGLSRTLSGSTHLKFKPKTLLVFISIVAVVFAAPGIWHQLQLRRLKSYADRNSGALDAHERSTVSSLADSVLSRQIRTDPFDREPLPSFLHSESPYVILNADLDGKIMEVQ